jgi:putative ABC transport system substrate-binding protein
LQILLEALPSVKRVGALWNSGEPNRATELETVQKAAAVSGVLVQSLPIDSADQLPPALDLSAQTGCEALLVLPGFLLAALQARIAEYTAQHRLPTMYSTVTRVSSGGLLAYAPDIRDIVRRSAVFVDRILQGARPADLPVEQPDKMSFVVNLHTAAALGVQLPPSVLAQATEVIQ